jgi:hypothetical protein
LTIRMSQGETILWQGKPPLPRALKTALGVYIVFFVFIQLLYVDGAPYQNQAGIDALVLGLLAFTLFLVQLNRGQHFLVTNERIVRITDLYFLKRTFQLPLPLLTDVRAGHYPRKPSLSYVIFIPPAEYYPITFGPIQDDSEKVREIALRAKAAVTGTSTQILAMTRQTILKASRRLIAVGGLLIAVAATLGIARVVEVVTGGNVAELSANIVDPIAFFALLGGIILFSVGRTFAKQPANRPMSGPS